MGEKAKIIHQIAKCLNCGMQWEDYRNGKARKQAAQHAKKTGHTVTGETGIAWDYNKK